MISVQNSQSMVARCIHICIYGPLRTGKSTFCATCRKPVILSIVHEGGDMGYRFFNVDVIRIGSIQDMKDAIAYIETYGKSKHGWETVCVDSLTYYSDLFIQEASKNGEKALAQRDWGLLDLHLQKWLLPKLQSLPYHVVWVANEDEVKDANGSVTHYVPSLYGKSKVKFPGATDLIVRSAVRAVRNSQSQRLETEYFLKTVSTDGSPCGGRFGPAFAEGTIPSSFEEIVKRVGPWIGVEALK